MYHTEIYVISVCVITRLRMNAYVNILIYEKGVSTLGPSIALGPAE